jgi:hypothetical protein
MGASPYSNVSIIDAADSQRFQRPQQLRYNKDHPKQLLQQFFQSHPHHQSYSNQSGARLLNYPFGQYDHQQQQQRQAHQSQLGQPTIKFDIPDHVVQDIIW